MMDIPPPLDGEFSSQEFPGTGTGHSGVSRQPGVTGQPGITRQSGVTRVRRAARSFRASALSARIARAGSFSPPHSAPVVSRAPSHATSGGA
jgi:hypothetical protein